MAVALVARPPIPPCIGWLRLMTYLTDLAPKKTEDPPPAEEEENESPLDQTPVRVVCPHCGLSVMTFIEHESSWVTYTTVLVLLLVLGWAALCVVPVVYPLFKDVVHHCPRCLSVLATKSRVVLPSFRNEVMSFRFGDCVIVLARKYVLMLLALMLLIGGVHMARSSTAAPLGIDALKRTETLPLTWENFTQDCGFKSYLGNPIHVSLAFNKRYKNNTFYWEGTVHHIEEGLSLLWWSQRGALFARMHPAQFPARDIPDLMLLFNEGDKVANQVYKLKRGASIGFIATMAEVGKRGSPHVMCLWEVLEAKQPQPTEAPVSDTVSLVDQIAPNNTSVSESEQP